MTSRGDSRRSSATPVRTSRAMFPTASDRGARPGPLAVAVWSSQTWCQLDKVADMERRIVSLGSRLARFSPPSAP